MSEIIYTIGLDELRKVRLICKQCGAAIEYVPDTMDKQMQRVHCPGCNKELRNPGADMDGDHLAQLAEALRGLQARAADIAVEFVIPSPPARP